MKTRLLFLALILLLSACAPAAVDAANGGDPTRPPQTNPDGTLLVYVKSGGFAGIHEEWRFYADGRLTAADGSTVTLSAQQTNDLQAAIAAADFAGLPERIGGRNTCADCFNYSLTVTVDGKTKTVSANDVTLAEMPAFADLLAVVEGLIAPLR